MAGEIVTEELETKEPTQPEQPTAEVKPTKVEHDPFEFDIGDIPSITIDVPEINIGF